MSYEQPEELPLRPRRRLLEPIPVLLLSVLMIASGFIGGVLVEKGQGASGSAGPIPSGVSSRLAALRGGAASAASGAGGTGFPGRAGGFAGARLGARGVTVGEVSYLDGSTLYVAGAQGNTVKVLTSPGSSITKTVKATIHDIHPGDTVIVQGAAGKNGAISASSISVNSGGGSLGGGLGGLFGASRGSSGSAGESGGEGPAGAGGGGPALFGPG